MGRVTTGVFNMLPIPDLAFDAWRNVPWRNFRHRRFLDSSARSSAMLAQRRPLRVLVLGVYLADRPNCAAHIRQRLSSVPGIEVLHRWVSLNGVSSDPDLARVSEPAAPGFQPKFVLINQLLENEDLARYDYLIVSDDDIYIPNNFLAAFLAEQSALDWAVAQPARALHSHFDHRFTLRRPWLRGRQTWFVECGPLVSFRRDAATVLMPFEHPEQMWGLDLVWPLHLRRADLKMGIVDSVSVEHSLRGQAVTYNKSDYENNLKRFLAATPHVPIHEAFTVVAKHR